MDVSRLIRKIKRFIKIRRTILLYSSIVLFLVFFLLTVYVGKVYLAEGKTGLIRTPIGRAMLAPYRSIRKISDIMYLGYVFKKDNLPKYRLEIDPNDFKFLNDNLPEPYQDNRQSRLTDEYRKPVPAKFYFEGREYKVKVNYRGYVGNHWSNAKKSWDIKFDDENLFNGLSGIKLIIPEDRGIVVEYVNQYRANKMGLYPLFSSFANLTVNGKNNGVYFQVEPWDENYLAKHELIDQTDMFAFYEDWNRSDRYSDSFEMLSYYDKSADNPIYADKNYAPLIYLFDLINDYSSDFEDKIANVLDVDQFLKWQSVHMLTSSPHNVYRNIRLFTDRETGKLVFVPWDIGFAEPSVNLEINGASLYNRIFMSDKFSYQRNKILWEYVGDVNNLEDDLKYYDDSFNNIKVALAKDHLKVYSTNWFFDKNKQLRQNIEDNFYRVRNILKNSRASISVYMSNDNPVYFDVIADMLPEIYLDKVRIYSPASASYQVYFDVNHNNELDSVDLLAGTSNYDVDKKYHLILSDKNIVLSANKKLANDNISFEYFPRTYRFFIKANNSEKVEKIKIQIDNAITDKKVDDRVQYINLDAYKYLSQKNISVDEFVAKFPIFRKIDNNTVKLYSGNYNLNADVIIPIGKKLIIDPGVTINLSRGVSLITYGPILASGTVDRPIVFSGYDVWGSVGISEAQETSVFDHVKFSNGQDAVVNGVYYSGMLSIYRSDVEINNSEFSKARADDAINVKHAKVLILNSVFKDNSADSIDFDFISDGQIKNNVFLNTGNDSIDLSGSSVLIENNKIQNSGDKGISIGEKSSNVIIYNNEIISNNIGIESKDLSQGWAINNVFVKNNTTVNAYKKKDIFGGGILTVYNSIFYNNGHNISFDDWSKIEVFNSNIADYSTENGNFSGNPDFNNEESQNFTNNPKNVNISFINGGNTDILRDKLNIDIEQAPVGLNK